MTTIIRMVAALGLVFGAWLLWGARSRDESMRAPIVRAAVKHPWLTTGAMGAVALGVAAVVVVSGVVPIKASSGHWAITAAFLDFAKSRSVATYSWGLHAPALDQEALLLRGATHYENACLPCHGGPNRPVPPVVSAMTPPPPPLDRRIARWSPEELFVIVKHGIKFTGMPGWPAPQRDDEIWAMVSFLRRLPKLDGDAYRRLAYGEAHVESRSDVAGDAPSAVRSLCSRCHGIDGTGRGPGAFPSLAGQRAAYLYESLRAFRDRRRFSAVMGEVAAKLGDDTIREIAEFYERLPPRQPETPSEESTVVRARTIATSGIQERDIPACVECHGPTPFEKNPAYPILAGQHSTYLRSQLMLLQERRRGGTDNVDLMHTFVDRLDQTAIDDVTAYYAALKNGSE